MSNRERPRSRMSRVAVAKDDELLELSLHADPALYAVRDPDVQKGIEVALDRMVRLFATILREEAALNEAGSSPAQAFIFIGEYMSDMVLFFEVLAGIKPPDVIDDDFPFDT